MKFQKYPKSDPQTIRHLIQDSTYTINGAMKQKETNGRYLNIRCQALKRLLFQMRLYNEKRRKNYHSY